MDRISDSSNFVVEVQSDSARFLFLITWAVKTSQAVNISFPPVLLHCSPHPFPPIATPTDSAVFYKRYKTAKPTFGVFKYKIRA
jgi:hypothetical protein